MPFLSNHSFTLAIIGGGRWGQVTLSVLANMNLPMQHIMVSSANFQHLQSIIHSLSTKQGTYQLVRSVSELLVQHHVNAAIIVNSARQHVATAEIFIESGVPALIEKPIALSSYEMNLMIKKAIANKTMIIPGLSYRFCSYITNFAEIVKPYGVPSEFRLDWHDSNNEIRYQQKKSHDHTINIAQDVMPHIWTILSRVFATNAFVIERCEPSSNSNDATFIVSAGQAKGIINLSRTALRRKRYLSLNFGPEHNAAIDFTVEPGTIINRMTSNSGDESWQTKRSPLTQQIDYFLSICGSGMMPKQEIDDCIDSVYFSETASSLLQKQIA